MTARQQAIINQLSDRTADTPQSRLAAATAGMSGRDWGELFRNYRPPRANNYAGRPVGHFALPRATR